ncbi:glycerophosphodiester phosphodiesterase [Tessaracoccus sp.]
MEPAWGDAGLPVIVGHRGASHDVAEQTLGAYLRAVEDGADLLECDLQLTADGELICLHDTTVNRTSNGHGAAEAMTLAALQELDFSTWKNAGAGRAPDTILTLNHLIEVVLNAGRVVGLALETKHPSRYGGAVEVALAKTLAGYGLDGPTQPGRPMVYVMSFSARAMYAMRSLLPGVPRIKLMSDYVPARVLAGGLPAGASVVGPGMGLIRRHPELVANHHDRGHLVNAWVVNNPADIDLCLELGVDVITTDRPGFVRDYVLGATRVGGLAA